LSYHSCKYCEKFSGDCGNHFKDKYGHTDFEIPKESVLDNYGVPNCFVDSNTKYKNLYERLREEIENLPNSDKYTLCLDKKHLVNILDALLIADKDEKSKR
jgi:hypothetical protein